MNFPIPDAALKRHTAILGMTGSGKSSTGRLMVEHVVAQGHRVCILDTLKSDWWGITSSANGMKAGLPFTILGGPRGHINLPSSAGKAIGRLVGDGKLPLSIVDMADFEPGGLQRFFIDFVPSLMKAMKGVVYLVIEEAHEVAPKERAGFGAENMAIHYAKKLGTGGRTTGIRLIVATQRIQALHNAVLGSCETVIAHRIGFADDQVPVLKWMKAKIGVDNAKVVESELANLPDGVAFIASGAPVKLFERVKFPLFKTFDNTKTPDGDIDDLQVETAFVDQAELRAIVGDTIKQDEDSNPEKLRAEISSRDREIASLKRQLAGVEVRSAAPDPTAIADAERRGYKAGFDAASRQGTEAIHSLRERAAGLIKGLRSQCDGAIADFDRQEIEFVPDLPAMRPALPADNSKAAPAPAHGVSSPAAGGGGGTLPGPEQKIVDAIRWWNVYGLVEPSHHQVGYIAGYAAGSGTWNRYLSSLRSSGMIEGRGPLVLTPAGRRAARAPATAPSDEALRGQVLKAIDGPLAKILEVLLTVYPRGLSHEDAAKRSGYVAGSGTWNRYLSSLRSLGLIEPRGDLKAQSWLFPR